MKKVDAEQFHIILNKLIDLCAAFTELPALSFVMKSVRLKPYSFIFEKYSRRIKLHNCWIDEFGNSFLILKDKKIEIILNDLKIGKNKLVNTDLYAGLPIEKVSKISKLMFFVSGKEEDFNSNYYIISFLGIDNILRTFVYLYAEWQPYPNLYLGIKNLLNIGSNLDIKTFIELKNKKNVLYPCSQQKSWLSFWPPSKDFISILKEQNSFVLDTLNISTKEK